MQNVIHCLRVYLDWVLAQNPKIAPTQDLKFQNDLDKYK